MFRQQTVIARSALILSAKEVPTQLGSRADRAGVGAGSVSDLHLSSARM